MNRVSIIGIGFRPLDKKAREALLRAEVVLSNGRLLEAFKDYNEYETVKERIKVLKDIYETKDYIRNNYNNEIIALLAVGDPMFFGIGRVIRDEIGKESIEVFPDLSSVQVAFSKIKEPSGNAFFLSLHGGPDPERRRKLEYEITEMPELLKQHRTLAILTDKINTPEKIAQVLLDAAEAFIARGPGEVRTTKQSIPSATFEIASPTVRNDTIIIYVCEKLGYDDEKITSGTAVEIAGMSFDHPNVVIIMQGDE